MNIHEVLKVIQDRHATGRGGRQYIERYTFDDILAAPVKFLPGLPAGV